MTSPKRKKAPAPRRPTGREGWTAEERHWDRVAARQGVKPVQDLAELAVLAPEDGQELLEAIQGMRTADALARQQKEQRKRSPRRA